MSTTTKETTGTGPSTEPIKPNSVGEALRDYVDKIRGGDIGSLPAILGFVALVILFSILAGDTFDSKLNWANLLNQSAATIFIAMGLIFVLLLGEIDLSAGYTAGVGGAILAVQLTDNGWAWPLAVFAALLVGAVIGLLIGLLVGILGVPSFVVTLAAFLALQGVLLTVIGQGGTIPVTDPTILKVMNSQVTPVLGWVMWVVVVVGYAAVEYTNRRGLLISAARVGTLAVLLGIVVAVFNTERSINPALQSLKGVPMIVPITIIFVVVLSFVLNRTTFGRHVYAIGGNVEAARRSGIAVTRVKITCFVIGSTLAAFGGILLVSRDNSVSPSTGGAQTLLLAVGAAVIGGTSLFGGKGRVVDAIIGGLVVGIIANGLPLVTERADIQFIVTGLVLLLAASVDALSRRRTAATGR